MITLRKVSAAVCKKLCETTMRSNFTVAVEGNIASGKTSLLEYFTNEPNVTVFPEPVQKWRNIQGHNALEKMYEDPSRWSLTFQTYVQLTMLENHTCPVRTPLKMLERSIFSAKYCFVENLHNSGAMPDLEHIVLTRWFDWIISNSDCHVDLIVYLRTRPEVVLQRVLARARHEEKSIPLEYLQRLHDLHENWLMLNTFPLHAPKLLVLDANEDQEHMMKEFAAKKDQILLRNLIPVSETTLQPPIEVQS